MTSIAVEQLTLFDADTPFTKTCQERSVPTKAETGKQSSRSSLGSWSRKPPMFLCLRGGGLTQDASPVWEQTDSPFPWLGESMTLNTGECRKDGGASACWLTSTDLLHRGFCLTLNMSECPRTVNPTKLSEILEPNADPKYNLSERACQGILNRAERRGKELPKELKAALMEQATPSRLGGGVERDSHGRKAGKGALIQTEKSATLGVSQDQTLIQAYGITDSKPSAQGSCPSTTSPSLTEEAVPIEGNGQRPSHRGAGIGESGDPSFTLNGTEHHGVAFGICSYDSNAMKSGNPHSGVYEADTSRTLDLNGGDPSCKQGGVAVVDARGNGGGGRFPNHHR